jgi:hypothetical protein
MAEIAVPEIVRKYEKEHPELFARLPFPKELAKQLGVPANEEIIHLKSFMSRFAAIQTMNVDAQEERVAMTVTEAKDSKMPQYEIKMEVLEKFGPQSK